LSHRHSFEMLGSHVPFTESFIVVSMPRGGLQIAQPARLSESLLQNYAREFHKEDRATWRAVERNHAMAGQELWGGGGGHESRYVSEFMQPAGLKYLAVAPLSAPGPGMCTATSSRGRFRRRRCSILGGRRGSSMKRRKK